MIATPPVACWGNDGADDDVVTIGAIVVVTGASDVVVSTWGFEVQAPPMRASAAIIDTTGMKRGEGQSVMWRLRGGPGGQIPISASESQQPREQEISHGERDGEDNGETIQVLFDHSRAADISTAHAAAEHVTHAATLARVKQDKEDQAQRNKQMENCNDSSSQRTNPFSDVGSG